MPVRLVQCRLVCSVLVAYLCFATPFVAALTVTGYLADNYCWDLNPEHRAIDAANLETEPQFHTRHCLIDVAVCVNSGYAILTEDSTTGKYLRTYKLDNTGNANAQAFLRRTTLINNLIVNATGTDDGNGNLVGATVVENANAAGGQAQRPAPVVLWLHVLCMVPAWGGLLPWGVLLANRMRTFHGAKEAAWFRMHQRIQILGWALQLVGFAMAIAYAQYYSAHFKSLHTYIGLAVVCLGTLQPLNAAVRPHIPDDGWPDGKKSTARILWEFVHKGSGYLAVVLGSVNIIIGLSLAAKYNFETALVVVGATLVVLGVGSATLFAILTWCDKEETNILAQWCVGLHGERLEAVEETEIQVAATAVSQTEADTGGEEGFHEMVEASPR